MTVFFESRPIKDAEVRLQPTARNMLAPVNGMLADVGSSASGDMFIRNVPNGRLASLTTKTDDKGSAVFAASTLAFGGVYQLVVLPNDTHESRFSVAKTSSSRLVLTVTAVERR